MATEDPTVDEGPPPDPFEAELVAYLDGELDEAAARNVEARLARDPAARKRAAELKKSFDLLEYLPRADPSPTFTTRTLDRLPSIKLPSGSSGHDAKPAPPASRPGRSAASTSLPVPLDEAPAARGRRLWWAVWLCAGVFACAAGYFATSLARTQLFAPRQQEEAKAEPPARAVENLPLYYAADDIAFATELARPEFFGDEPAALSDPTLRTPADTPKPTGAQVEALAKAFHELPPARQAEVVKLDEELHAKEPRERDRLLRALEAYAAWLERLPEPQRKRVLAAPAAERLAVVAAVRERQWLDSLPPSVRARPDLVRQWREERAVWRDRLALNRQHAEAFAANKTPWPFDNEAGRKDVVEYARAVFKTDDPKRCRLSSAELAEYKRLLAAAQADGEWAWYGLHVYELSRAHPYLPEAERRELMITEVKELPEPYLGRATPKKGFRPRLNSAGKWPDFPLEVLREIPLREGPFVKGPLPALGPARLSEFKQPVRDFSEKELFPKMTDNEKRDLRRLEGKWPDYPQRVVFYAYKYDLSVPGVTLPGPPRKWDATYGIRPRPRR